MKLYVWGTGCGAAEAIERGLDLSQVSGFIDNTPSSEEFLGLPVLSPSHAASRNPDLIIVTCRHAEEIGNQCRELGIPAEKILYLKENNRLVDRNFPCIQAEKILGNDLLSRLLPEQYIVTCPDSLRNAVLSFENDYVRLAVLELLCRRIQNIPGDLAELGVYKGKFASCINRLLPDRVLYMFDSFTGFSPTEGEREKNNCSCKETFLQAHKNTDIESVLSVMPNPRSVQIMAGFFPESLHGLEAKFALVSLDADFYETTLEGLRYFWPRMSDGGYIMLHDWGSPRLKGVEKALSQYEKELGFSIPSVPIPDIGSSMILQKR